MKTKVVRHIASLAMDSLLKAQGEAANMLDAHRDLLSDSRKPGPGLDFAVLREHLNLATERLKLLM